MSFRAVEVLKSVHMIVAEDTRHSRTLLDEYGIKTPYSPCHEHNEAAETPRLVSHLKDGKSIALITDAGTPLVSDPGARLTRAAIEAQVQVIAIPGSSAVLAGLVVSGIAAEQFTFLGFLPRKGKERQQAIDATVRSSITTVIYEAPGRVADTLNDLVKAGAPDRQASVSRELTKKFEETRRGTITELAAHFGSADAKGEFVLVISGAEAVEISDDDIRSAVAQMKQDGRSPREITDRLIAQFGTARNRAYKFAHE
ncbi:MAG: 16S rRNA (cytidine(1402)-2'-O)-methyltransferase [Gemmatimonadaceae bacterium]|nr:16S rRNA (cytidine(1402)-2'-O)-methyltransferase [Gemmatimonadaceae bacterium]